MNIYFTNLLWRFLLIFFVPPSSKNNKKYYLINDIKENNTFEKGGNVSDVYKQKTGKNWNTAKLEGLTNGSYEENIKLKSRLLSGEFDNIWLCSKFKNAQIKIRFWW